MRPIKIVSFFVMVLAVGGLAFTHNLKHRSYISNYEFVLGTSLELRIDAASPEAAAAAEQAALNEIDRLDAILSSYKFDSEFSRWASKPAGPVKVSAELFEILNLFDNWKVRSGGALNPAAETFGKIWKNAAAAQVLPAERTLDNAISEASNAHWQLNTEDQTATRLDNVPLAINSFVKSYIIAKATEQAMLTADVSNVVVNIGGDIVTKGAEKEVIAIANPLADAENDLPLMSIAVENSAVATSGNYRRGYQIGNKWFSHIIDPRTGVPVNNIISATIVAEDAGTAGALATAFNVLSVEESRELAAKHPGVAYLIVTRTGDMIKNEAWKAIEVATPREEITARPASSDKLWNTKMELNVSLELAAIQGQRIYRPFVAIWVEDADGKPVRNLVIWFNKAKWLPDLKDWYRNYGLDFNAAGNPVKATSSATRSPGKYTVKWDGKDDKGNLVKAGTYKVNIEVVREHGTYQLLTQEMNFNGTARSINLKNNVEVASASLDYRKKAK